MENLLIIDRQPLMRIGLKLLIESHFPKFKLFEANCRYSVPDSISRKVMSITILGFDPDHERVELSDIAKIRGQLPGTKLVIYGGNLDEQSARHFRDLGVFACISKRASAEALINCLRTTLHAGELSLV